MYCNDKRLFTIYLAFEIYSHLKIYYSNDHCCSEHGYEELDINSEAYHKIFA